MIKKVAIGAGILWAVFIVGGAVILTSSTSPVNPGGTSEAAAAQTSTATPPTQPASTQIATPPSVRQQIASWTKSYEPTLTAITNDLSSIATDGTNADEVSMAADCQQLQTDITTAQGQPGIPDATAEQHWSSALSYLSSAAQDCSNGLTNNDVNQIQQGANEISQGNTQIVAANQALKQYE